MTTAEYKTADSYHQGLKGEELVAEKLRKMGLKVELTEPTAEFDLLVDGNVRVEVKSSVIKNDTTGSYFKFQLSQPVSRKVKYRRTQGNRVIKNYKKCCDLVVLVGVDTDSTTYFVLPSGSQIIKGKKGVRYNTSSKKSQLNRYVGAFGQVFTRTKKEAE